MENKKVVKYLKSYLTAKKYCNSDIDKSFDYLKLCVKILDDIKENNIKINDEYINIVNETETECCKVLNNVIYKTLEKPICNKLISTDNELFDIIETGSIHNLKKYNYGEINFNIYNEYGLTPLHYAIKFGDTNFLKKSFILGAKIDQTNKYGHTLLEYACLEKDPNMINFLLVYGSNMKKHLLFRDNNNFFNNGSQIDIIILEQLIMNTTIIYNDVKYLNFIFNYIDENINISLEIPELNNITVSKNKIIIKDLIIKLENFLNNIDDISRDTYINIIKEELNNELLFKLGCPINKLEILLYNLCPFINYNNLSLDWLISLEIKYIILKILKNKLKINIPELKNELSIILYESYIKNDIISKGLIQIIVLQWFSKIKV